MSRIRGVVAVLAAVLVVGTGCTRSDDGASGEAAALGALEALAGAGIAVYSEPGTGQPMVPVAEPVSPVELVDWQVRVMELEAIAGGGVPASVLDGEVDTDGDGPPDGIDVTPSGVILNWVRLGDTAAASYARELLGDSIESDGSDLLIPQLVLVLFTSDIARMAQTFPEPAEVSGDSAPGPTPSTDPSAPSSDDPGGTDTGAMGPDGPTIVNAVAVQSGPCSAATKFVTDTISWVFNRIGHLQAQQLTRPGIFGLDQIVDAVNFVGKLVVGGVNFIIDQAHFVIESIGKVAISTVLGYVGKIAATVGTISMIASYIRPWTLHIDPEILLTEAPDSDAATARVDLGGLDEWPAWAQDCATQAGKPLPPLRPEGNRVTWDLTHELIAPVDVQTTLQPGGTAQYAYTVVADPPGPGRRTVTDDATLRVTVQRDDTREIQEAFSGLIRAQLGSTIGQIVYGFIQPFAQRILDRAFSTLSHLRDLPGRKRITIRYGIEDDEQSPNPPGAAGPGAPRTIPDVCDLLTDEEVARVLGYQVGYVNSTRETRETAIAQGLPVSSSFQWSEFCEKSTEDYEDYWATPPGSRIGLPPEVGWIVIAYADESGARDKLAEHISAREEAKQYASLPSYARLDGIGDEAIVDPGVAAPPYLVVRVGTYVAIVDKAFTADNGLPHPPDTFVEIGRIIAGRL